MCECDIGIVCVWVWYRDGVCGCGIGMVGVGVAQGQCGYACMSVYGRQSGTEPLLSVHGPTVHPTHMVTCIACLGTLCSYVLYIVCVYVCPCW